MAGTAKGQWKFIQDMGSSSQEGFIMVPSQKHTYIILTPLNPTFIQ